MVFFQKLKRLSRTKDVLLVRGRLCIARMVRILFLFQIESFQSLCHQHLSHRDERYIIHALTTVTNTSVTEMKDTCPNGPNHFACHISFILSDANAGKILTKKQRQKRDLEWQQMKRDERVRLREEMRKFSDILLVPNVDVYRNRPSQLMEFYRWYKELVFISI